MRLETDAESEGRRFFPLIVGATIGLLIMFIAPISQASFNPARDLGPRIMLLLVGFGSVAFPGPNHGLSLIATTIGPIIGGIIGALFFDKVMRPNIPGHEVEGSHVTTLSQLAYDPTMEVRSETLHGHAARLPLEAFPEVSPPFIFVLERILTGPVIRPSC